MPKNENKKDPTPAKDQQAPEVEEKEQKQDASEAKPEASKPKSNGKRLLIVEDEKPLAHALELKFAHEGYETKLVEDGKQALEAIAEFKPNGILLDLIMPNMDGFQHSFENPPA